MGLDTLFGGKHLIANDGTEVTCESLKEKKCVGIYFSAHWCPPCRSFTPMLAEWYNTSLKEKGMELVFVSSDRDEAAFKEYAAEQPWLSLPYDARDAKAELSKKFKVQGIPTLVIVDNEGNLITKNGREAVSSDPKGEDLPWKPKPIKEIVGTEFVSNQHDGIEPVSDEFLKGKYIGLYFSAHWCPPCRGFTPKLIEAYNAVKAAGHEFQIIFVSSDHSEEEFKSYFGEHPWIALPYANSKTKNALSSRFEVSGIPHLVIMDEKYNVINGDAVGVVHGDPEGKDFPWRKPLVNDIDKGPAGIDDQPSLILMLKSDADKAKYTEMLTPFAQKYKADSDAAEFGFYMSTDPAGQISERVRDDCSIDADKEIALIMVDLEDSGAFYNFDGGDVTPDTLEAFFEAFKAKALPRQQMS